MTATDLGGSQHHQNSPRYSTILKTSSRWPKIVHGTRCYLGQHEPILSRELWDQVAARLSANNQTRRRGKSVSTPSMLRGILGSHLRSHPLANSGAQLREPSAHCSLLPLRHGEHPVPQIEGQKSMLSRTMHDIVFDGIHRSGGVAQIRNPYLLILLSNRDARGSSQPCRGASRPRFRTYP